MRNLRFLDLSRNEISGTIPIEIGDLINVERIALNENRLSGSMPDSFMHYKWLMFWDTFGNFMTGDLPESISNCSTLQFLFMQLEHSDTLRRYRCKDRIPGARLNFNYPTKAGYAKFNWIIVVPEYYNMKYIAHCEEMYDVNFAFNALSGDV